jgi:hypothetical protein
VLHHFEAAWRRSLDKEPELENGGPVDLLHDSHFSCSKPVPWKQEVEKRFALSSDSESPPHPCPAPGPAPGPSRSHSALTFFPKLIGANAPTSHDSPNDSPNAKLAEKLKTTSVPVTYNTFPRIKDGFFPKYVSNLHNHKKNRLTVVFPLIPQYVIQHVSDHDVPSAEISAIEIDQSDYNAIAKHDPLCLRHASDQSKCAENKIRYFCSSWVCPHFSLVPCVCPDLTRSPQLTLPIEMMEHKDLWQVKFLSWKVFSKAVITQKGATWDLLNKADLLIGGVNFTNNFL